MPMMGECPYDDCGEIQWRELPDVPLPAMGNDTCEGCGRVCWVRYSRVDPKVWTVDGSSKSSRWTRKRGASR